MTDAPNAPKLAIQVILAVGAQAQSIFYPVADATEAVALMKRIQKTPGFFFLGEETNAPIMFHVRHIVMMQIVLLPAQPAAPPQIARLTQ